MILTLSHYGWTLPIHPNNVSNCAPFSCPYYIIHLCLDLASFTYSFSSTQHFLCLISSFSSFFSSSSSTIVWRKYGTFVRVNAPWHYEVTNQISTQSHCSPMEKHSEQVTEVFHPLVINNTARILPLPSKKTAYNFEVMKSSCTIPLCFFNKV